MLGRDNDAFSVDALVAVTRNSRTLISNEMVYSDVSESEHWNPHTVQQAKYAKGLELFFSDFRPIFKLSGNSIR